MSDQQDSKTDFPDSSHWEHYEAISISKSYLNQNFSSHQKSEHEIFMDLKKKADEGSILARIYEKINDNEQAFYYYQLAKKANRDSTSLQVEIEKFIHRFIQQSPEQAFNCIQLAANQNDPFYLYFLGHCFLKGIGTTPSIKKACSCYRLAALQGYLFSLTPIARTLFDIGIGQKMIARLLKSIISDQSNIPARHFYDLAKLFAEGKILIYSPEAVVHFYTLSAELGYTSAQSQLADIYFQGLFGMEKNEQLAMHYYILGKKITAVINLAKQYEKEFPSKAFAYYQLVYESDKVKGAQYLGHCYEEGIGIEKSLATAIHYYKIAYAGGIKSIAYNLGGCFEKMGEDEALIQAIHYYQIGAQQNDGGCQYRLAKLFEQGKGLPQSFEEAFHYYSLAANNEFSSAWFQVGHYLANGIGTEKSEEKAVKAYELCGDTESQYQLAICYLEGKGVNPSVHQAMNYLIYLSKKGVSQAYSKLADLLETKYQIIQFNEQNKDLYIPLGKRFETLAQQIQDKKIANICFQIVGELGGLEDAYQQFRLAVHYDHIKDYEKAFEFFNRAANQGYDFAQYALGRYFQQGKGCSQSWEKAIQCYNLAANQGNAQAFFELGLCYDRGLGGLKRSYQHAFENFKLSANQGYPKALCALGLYYEMGRYVERSVDQAFDYFKLAADQDDAEGQYHVGRFYRLGRQCGDVLLSLKKAINYYNLALENRYRKEFLKNQIKHCQQLINIQHEIITSCSQLPFDCVIFPHAKKLDIRLYLKDRNPLTLRKIFRRSRHQQIFLEGHDITMDEAKIIRDGMVENPRLTFLCPKSDIERIYLAFELAGYPRTSLRCLQLRNLSAQLFGLLFVGDRKSSK